VQVGRLSNGQADGPKQEEKKAMIIVNASFAAAVAGVSSRGWQCCLLRLPGWLPGCFES